jgi:hypothetical protein
VLSYHAAAGTNPNCRALLALQSKV